MFQKYKIGHPHEVPRTQERARLPRRSLLRPGAKEDHDFGEDDREGGHGKRTRFYCNFFCSI